MVECGVQVVRHDRLGELQVEARGHHAFQGAVVVERGDGDQEEVVDVRPGLAVTLPVGTEFQFRSTSGEPLAAVGVTMPPWPGPGEAVVVDGPWTPTVEPGPA